MLKESNILISQSLCPSDPLSPHPVMIYFYLSYAPEPRETSSDITTCRSCLHTTEPGSVCVLGGGGWGEYRDEMNIYFQ